MVLAMRRCCSPAPPGPQDDGPARWSRWSRPAFLPNGHPSVGPDYVFQILPLLLRLSRVPSRRAVGADLADARPKDGVRGAAMAGPPPPAAPPLVRHRAACWRRSAPRLAMSPNSRHDFHLLTTAIRLFDLLFGVIVIDCWLLWAAPRMQPIALRPAVVLGSLLRRGRGALPSAATRAGIAWATTPTTGSRCSAR